MKTFNLFFSVVLFSTALQPAFADEASDARADARAEDKADARADEEADARANDKAQSQKLLPQTSSCDNLPAAEKQKCQENWNSFADLIKTTTPLALGAMGAYGNFQMQNLKKRDYRKYATLMQASGLPFAPPSAADMEAQCLKALAKFERSRKPHEIMTVRKPINGKLESFAWDGKKLWRIDSKNKSVQGMDPGTSYSDESDFRHAGKTAVWSLAQQEKSEDGRLTKRFPVSAVEEITAAVIETSFNSAQKSPGEMKANIAPACRDVYRVKVTQQGSRVSVADVANRALGSRSPSAIEDFVVGPTSAPRDAIPPKASGDCVDCVNESHDAPAGVNLTLDGK